MKQRHSDVFEQYTKIILDKGLVKVAESEDAKDSGVSAYTLLYGVNPNKDQKLDIIDQAHPDPVIIAPAYDKVNGLVENIKERKNIMMHIVNKPVNGLLMNHIYAKASEDLLNEVIKISFMLDRENEEQLMKLADNCLAEIVANDEEIAKVAAKSSGSSASVAGAAALVAKGGSTLAITVGVVAVVAALWGSLYVTNNPSTQGLKNDIDRTLEEMQEAVDDYPQLGSVISSFVEKLSNLKGAYVAIMQENDSIANMLLDYNSTGSKDEKYKEVTDNVMKYVDSGRLKNSKKSLEDFKNNCKNVSKAIPMLVEIFRNADNRYEESDSDWWHGIKKLWRGYVLNSDAEDAARMLELLAKSLNDADKMASTQSKYLSELESVKTTAQSQLEQLIDGLPPSAADTLTEPQPVG